MLTIIKAIMMMRLTWIVMNKFVVVQISSRYDDDDGTIRAFSVVGLSTYNGFPSELRIFNRTTSPAFFLTFRLLCLTVLVLGALLSSFLEEVLYKCSI